MAIVARKFCRMSVGGNIWYHEGQEVPDEVGKMFPHFMEGYKKKAFRHNPNLPAQLSKKMIAKMSEEDLIQWLDQFSPSSLPPADMRDLESLKEAVILANRL